MANGKSHMAWVRSFRKKKRGGSRRRGRSNPYQAVGAVATPNPPGRVSRTYRRARTAVVKYKARRAARREGKSMNILGISLPPLETVLYTGVGIVGTPMVEGFASRFLPLDLTTNVVGRYALKVGSVLGLAWLAKVLLGPNEAKAIGAGGGAYVLVSALREFAPGVVGMSSYSPMASYVNNQPRLNSYSPMAGPRPSALGLGASSRRDPRYAGR